MLECIKVEMPKKRVVVNQRGYVCYATKYYRNEEGKSITERISIGKKDLETGMLIPNDNYFKLFDCNITIKVKGLK